MQESIKLDLRGEIRIDFADAGLFHIVRDPLSTAFSRTAIGRRILFNQLLPYSEITFIGAVRRRQWWLLGFILLFIPLGVLWVIVSFGNWGASTASLVVLLWWGIWPLVLFIRGRTFLGIASNSAIILLPMDRNKKQLRRIVGLLSHYVSVEQARWDLAGTPLENCAQWDTSPRIHKPFNTARYLATSALLGTWALGNLIHMLHNSLLDGAAIVLVLAALWSLVATFLKRK